MDPADVFLHHLDPGQPWNPANVMRGSDGRLVVADLFYPDGPALYATVRTDPDRIVRDSPRTSADT